MEFSPDSRLVLIIMSKKNLVEVRSVYEEEWAAKIEDPVIGILNAKWSPDSRCVLIFSDYQLKLSIYSLADKTVQYIKNPKYPDRGAFCNIELNKSKSIGISFTNDGKFMALTEKKDTKDYIGVYYTGDWKLVNVFCALFI